MAEIFTILISSLDGFWFSRYQVRNGGLLTAPPPTTMPESNTTSTVFNTSVSTITNHDVQEVTGDLLNEIDVVFQQQFAEFDDSPETDSMMKKCNEADRTGQIPECTGVRKYSVTVRMILKL